MLAQRVWQAGAGMVTLIFVTHFLSPIEQGYFYTLASLAALHMALDLGLSTVLVQFSAKEFIGLSWGAGGVVLGGNSSRFLTLVRLSIRWYCIAAVIFLFIYPAGIVFIGNSHGDPGYSWHGPWALLICATAVCLMALPALSLTEGSGRVAEVYLIRLIQGVIGAVTVWTVLAMGGGLYAVAMMPTISAVVACIWLFIRRRRMILQAFREKNFNFHWKVEVWPFQWRIGGSWFAGYALVSMHVPVLFQTRGPIEAGQMGITMTIANMLTLLSLSWVTAKIPSMSRFVTIKDWVHLDEVYWQAFRMSCLTFVSGAMGFMILRFVLEWTPYGKRFLPVMETAELLLAMGCYHVYGLFGAYLRAHFREPFLLPSLIGAILTAGTTIWAASRWGSGGVVTVLVIINSCFFFPIALYLLIHLRQKWHCEAE